MKSKPNPIETIIDGTTDASVIHEAVTTYMDGITSLAFPDDLATVLPLRGDLAILKKIFSARAAIISAKIEEIIGEINKRASLFRSADYQSLCIKDTKLWQKGNSDDLLFGALACVDKGVPAEAVSGPTVSAIGRTLGGDIGFSYIESKHAFVPNPSSLIKRFIHYARQGHTTLVEPLIEHTSCGRRGQILANEGGNGRQIPSLGFIFDHFDALRHEFPDTKKASPQLLSRIVDVWRNWERHGVSVVTPDAGLYAGIVQKIAQRQALRRIPEAITLVSPIEVYEKDSGNLYVGLDSLGILTDSRVIGAGGFTRDVLGKLADSSDIFSLFSFEDELYPAILHASGLKRGTYTFQDLQHDWIHVMTDFVRVTSTLWALYENGDTKVNTFVDAYFAAWTRHNEPHTDLLSRRLIHHLFHVTSYAYVLDTKAKSHPPGAHHMEQYLATGNHETGMKPLIALGQGDLDRPDANEIFTGYSVLLHSSPGHDGTPIPVTVKLDTDRTGTEAMSTEETNVAIDDLGEFLKLWPYFLVGDLVPILMVRGKKTGGVSRLGLSVLKSFGDMATLYQQSHHSLPRFVPATNSQNEVVLVPAKNVLETGIESGESLKDFRNRMILLADQYSDDAVQRGFERENS